jgi:hypothetical protein
MRSLTTATRAGADDASTRARTTRRVAMVCLLAATASAGAYQGSPSLDRFMGYRSTVQLSAAGDVVPPIASAFPLEAYTGRDSATGVPRYLTRSFRAEERRLLRAHFGVDDPTLLYRNDEGFIVVDSRRDTGLRDFVNTHRIGAISARVPGETYRELEARVRGRPAEYFGPNVNVVERRIEALDPAVQPAFRELLAEATQRGLRVTVLETYRSPERQAYLLGQGRGLTYTATSMHADRRGVDFRIGNGDLRDARTRAAYAAFRQLAITRGFTLAGDWDPGHVALPDPAAQLGFQTIEELLAAAKHADSSKVARNRAAGRLGPPGE